MSFTGVNVNKLNGGLGRSNPSTDNVMLLAFVIPLAVLPAGLVHNTTNKLLQPEDAEPLGIDESFDANNKLLCYNAISEFFRNSPDGVLYFVPVAESQSSVEIMQLSAFQQAVRTANDAKGIAIGGTTETFVGLADMVEDVQTVIESFRAAHRLIDFVVLQGNGAAAVTAIADYVDLRTKNAPNVSISIAQDPAVAALDATYAKYADVGAVLGMIAVRQVNENLGSVDIIKKPSLRLGDENYTLTGPTQWLGAALSDGTPFDALSDTDCGALTAKGYIYAGSFEGYGGMYFNGSPTCVEANSDYAYIENNRTWNKAARAIRLALIPKVRGVVKKDPQTGYIRSTTISSWENLAKKALGDMEKADEVSGSDVYIDPKQILSETTPLMVKAQLVVDGIVYEFDVNLGLVNSLS